MGNVPNPHNIKLIVGLGNPGQRYANTRHNLGFMVIDELVSRHHIYLHQKNDLALETQLNTCHIIKPLTFMNASGQAVKTYAETYKLNPENILVIHDDLDLPLGRLRFKRGGSGAGGQRGVQNIIDSLDSNFLRLKLGINHPPKDITVLDWVLTPFTKPEVVLVEKVIREATKAIELLLKEDLTLVMSRFNGSDLR